MFNPVNISLVYAQEETPTDSPAPTDTPTCMPTDTPSPTPTPTPDQSIITGNSTSSGDSQTASNVADISTTPSPTPEDSPTPDPEATDSASPTDTPTDTPTPTDISVDQSGVTSTDTTSSADSGNNSQAGSGSSAMTTGDAGATASSITITNLAEVNSNLITAVQNVLTSDTPNIDLYQALMSAIANNPNFVPANADITVDQKAITDTNTASTSNTGDNTQTAKTAAMTTGDAVSLANAINAVNLNLVGSNTVLTIINILADWNGNIILPNGSQFSIASLLMGGVNVNTNQTGIVMSSTSSSANSGDNNQAGGSNMMSTGNAISSANSTTLTNVIQIGDGQGYLIINNLGGWTGDLVNWNAPGSVQSLDTGSYNLVANYGDPGNSVGGGTNITSNQVALVNTNVSSGANSGGNFQIGKVTNLITGNAFSLANNFTLANFTSVGGGLFFGIINIVGKWTGSAITAYPELNVSVTDDQDTVNPGGAESYFVTITNAGHAIAHGVSLNFAFPGEVIADGTQNTSWNLGDFAPGFAQTFKLTGHVSDSVEDGTNLLASATGSTPDTQDLTSGNTGTDTTDVVLPPDAAPDTRTPDLHVETWTNVGAFVYPGDTVLASVTVRNPNPFIARNVEVKGRVSDGSMTTIVPLDWKLGDLKPNGKAKISFNITLKKDAPGGVYHLFAQASGQSESGDTSISNLSDSPFRVYAGVNTTESFIPPVSGTTSQGTGGGGEILGLNTQKSPFNINGLIPYTLPMLVMAYMLIFASRRKLNGEPVVSPGFIDFIRKRGAVFAGGFSILIIAIGIFIRKRF